MASVIAGGLFNAIAFAGAGFLFSKLNHHGYQGEVRRHNEAMEKLVAAKEKFYEEQVRRKNINETNKTWAELARVTSDYHNEEVPKIQDFYEPSQEMKWYENVAGGIAGLGVGYVATKALAMVI